MKADSYFQCTLTRDTIDGKRGSIESVEWVAKHIAVIGQPVRCNGHIWVITHVGQESADPRSAHECKT